MSFYVATVFYFSFGEVISLSKVVGLVFMVPCVLLLSLEPKAEVSSDGLRSGEEMRVYGLLAVLVGSLAPILWTIKVYFARRAFERKDFVPLDLAIDLAAFRAIFSCILYAMFLAQNPFNWEEFG